MTTNITAVYENGVFKPEQPVRLQEKTRVHLMIEEEQGAQQPPTNRGRLAALAVELDQDPRSFDELTTAERRERLGRLRGSCRGLTSGSEQFARQKLEEIALEDRKFA